MRRLPLLSVLILLALMGCGTDILSPRNQVAGGASNGARGSAAGPLSASAASATQISLSWTDNERNETGWEVQRQPAGGAFAVVATLGANTTSYMDNGLAPGTDYCYRVRSFRTAGKNTTYTAFSNVACSKTPGPPPAPGGLDATAASSRSVSVVWGLVAADSYRLERAPDPAGPWTVITTLILTIPSNYLDYGVTQDVRSCYRVFALNAIGASPPSNVDCVTPPAPPVNVAAAANGSAIDVTWDDAGSNTSGFQLLRAVSGTSGDVIATLPATARSYTDATAAPDLSYFYAVRRVTADGVSDYAYTPSVAIISAAPGGAGVDATAVGSTVVGISWWNTSGIAQSVRLQRSSDGVSGWTDIFSGNFSTGYFYDEGRTAEERVCYRAFVSNDIGESPASNVDCTTPLAAATDLRISRDYDTGALTATWADNSQHEEGYFASVLWCDDSGYCEWGYDIYLEPNTTTVTVTAWYETISDVRAFGDGGYSDPATWAADMQAVQSSLARWSATRPAQLRPDRLRPAPARLRPAPARNR